ncbi:MAG TPA: flagellar type III secretion system pore protein FliP [Candidatus Xenobia bacterium]
MSESSKSWLRWGLATALMMAVVAWIHPHAQAQELKLPDINIGEKSGGPKDLALPLELLVVMTTLTLAPYILIMTTSFIRIMIVLSFLKTAMGTQQVPPAQVLMGLALFMTFFIMQPTLSRINTDALQPYYAKKLSQAEFFGKVVEPLKEFMYINCRPHDIELFLGFSKTKPLKISGAADVPIYVLLPAYMTSEVKTAFAIGFLLYIPFVVVDMVVASVLMSMGMFMLSPTSISLPFKLLLFVMINGWELIITGLINSFKQPAMPGPS